MTSSARVAIQNQPLPSQKDASLYRNPKLKTFKQKICNALFVCFLEPQRLPLCPTSWDPDIRHVRAAENVQEQQGPGPVLHRCDGGVEGDTILDVADTRNWTTDVSDR